MRAFLARSGELLERLTADGAEELVEDAVCMSDQCESPTVPDMEQQLEEMWREERIESWAEENVAEEQGRKGCMRELTSSDEDVLGLLAGVTLGR